MTQPPAPAPATQDLTVKRLRYYYGQFLQAEDFTDEQQYHIDQRQRLARLLQTPGILEGLDVSVTNNTITVAPGTAVDGLGRLIVLVDPTTPPPAGDANPTKILTIAYAEQMTDIAASEPRDATRVTEGPILALVDSVGNESPVTSIPLAQLTCDANGVWSVSPDSSMRLIGGLKAGGLSVSQTAAVTGSLTVSGALSANGGLGANNGPLQITGDLSVSGALTAKNGITVESGDLTVSAGKLTVSNLLAANNGITVAGGDLTVSTGLSVGGVRVTAFSTDSTFADTSDAALPTALAVKTYVEAQISKLGTQEGTDLGQYVLSAAYDQFTLDVNGKLSELTTALGGKAAKDGDINQTFAAREIDTTYLYSEIPGNPNTGMSLKCEHHGSNFIVRPQSPGGTTTIIENTGGGGLSIQPDGADVVFGANNLGQMLNLSDTQYGIGVQSNTLYFRSYWNFAWYQGGSHINSQLDAGGGTPVMIINAGNVGIGTTSPLTKLHLQDDMLMQTRGATVDPNKKPVPSMEYQLLTGAPSNTVLFGGCNGNSIYFYWKDDSNNQYGVKLQGTLYK